MLKSLSIHIF